MRHSSGHHHGSADSKTAGRGDWRVIRDLLPYLLEYRFRVLIALSCLIAAKVTNLGIPIVLKDLIDSLNINVNSPQALLVVPLGIIIAYGLLRNLHPYLQNFAKHYLLRSPRTQFVK